MKEALSKVREFFMQLTKLGWFDKIAQDIHPDEINSVCDAVVYALATPQSIHIVMREAGEHDTRGFRGAFSTEALAEQCIAEEVTNCFDGVVSERSDYRIIETTVEA